MQASVLFLSNGYGEDTIAAGIICELQARAPHLAVKAMPLVGHGTAYEAVGVPRLGPQELMPSGGLVNAGVQHLVRDLKAGLVRLTLQQIRHLHRNRDGVDLVVAVGDTYPVLLGALFSRRPMVFVGTAKSNWFVPYSSAEAAIFRSCCARVFVRDEPTAAALRDRRVAAEWVGNAMMDCLEGRGLDLHLDGKTVIGILPGSREATYSDLPVLLEAVEALGSEYDYVAALADSIEEARLAARSGWHLTPPGRPGGDTGVNPGVGSLDGVVPSSLTAQPRQGGGSALVQGALRVTLTRRALGSVLEASR
ncbi:MAG: hypothetical protein ACYCW6_22690, partial [Candidatus Xenobia bacterium]